MLLTIIVFLLILGILIFVHELGHFVTAKKLGIKVEEFGFGFPPRMFGIYKDKKGKWKKVFGGKKAKAENTIYSINWLPLGGFVKIFGEEGEGKENPESFASKPVWKRSLVLAAGVFMNFVLAAILLIFGFKIGLPQAIDSTNGDVRDEKIQIAYVASESPAEESGLAIGDEIITVGGESFENIEDIQNKIKDKSESEILLEVKRGDEIVEIKSVPRKNPPEDEGALGISLVKTGIVSYPWHISILKGVEATFAVTIAILDAFYKLIRDLFVGEKVTADFAGPVGIAVMTGQVTRMGFAYVLQFAAVLSINLAIINILPFPALDGGRILFLLIEKIRGKKVGKKIENAIHTAGFFLLILLLVVVTFKDLFKFKDLFIGIWHKIAG